MSAIDDRGHGQGKVVGAKEWQFAPNFSARPDDKIYLEEDKKLTGYEAIAQTRADAHGAHEPPIRAGEERLLDWVPDLMPGQYTVNAKLRYTTYRFSDRQADYQAEMGGTTLLMTNR